MPSAGVSLLWLLLLTLAVSPWLLLLSLAVSPWLLLLSLASGNYCNCCCWT